MWDVTSDLTNEEGKAVRYKCPPQCPFQATMRAGVAPDAPVTNHVTNISGCNPLTRQRIVAVPRRDDPPGPGRIDVCAHPNNPPQAGDCRDIPFDLLPAALQKPGALEEP